MKEGVSVLDIVRIAEERGEFVALKYHHRHRKVREKCRRLCKEGKLKFLGQVNKTLRYGPVEFGKGQE